MEAIHRRRSMNVLKIYVACYFNTYYCVFCKNFAHIFTSFANTGGKSCLFYIESNLLCLPHLVFDLLIFACK